MHHGWSQPSQWSRQIESDTSARSQRMTTQIPMSHHASCFPMVAHQVKQWLESVPRWYASAPHQGSSSNSGSRRQRAAAAMKNTEGRFALVASSRQIIPDLLCHKKTPAFVKLESCCIVTCMYLVTLLETLISQMALKDRFIFVFIYYTARNFPAQ